MAQINKPNTQFSILPYSGTNTSTSYNNGLNMSANGGLVWIKPRVTGSNGLWDSVRGATNYLSSNSTSAESQVSGVTSFDTTGFTLGVPYNDGSPPNTFVSWSWLAGGTAVSNTQGTITSSVSANTTAGFSIVSYTGTGSVATVGHGLGVAPSMMIIKKRNVSEDWMVYHKSLTATNYIKLNLGDQTFANSVVWNNTEPTSSSFTIATSGAVNTSSATYIAYCFAEKKGFSKFGSYTGNGSADGTFVYTGFKPAFVMVKRTDSTGSWLIHDNKRNDFNVADLWVASNLSNAESTSSAESKDFLSNGWKIRGTGTAQNVSGGTYIYMAFAESPLVGTNNIPTTAR